MTSRSRERELRAVVRAATEEIDAAYWRFTRCARGVPPSMAVPEAYVQRREALRELRELQRSAGAR